MTPRTDEQLDRIRDASREKILASALELFARRGFARTSVRVLAERAGVSQGLLYNYFDGKEGVLRAIFEKSMADVGETLAAAEGAAPSEALAVLVRAAFEAVGGNRHFWMLSYQVRMQPEVLADVGGEVVAWAEQIHRRIEDLMVRAGVPDPSVRARLLFAAIDGVAQHYVLDPDRYPIEGVAEEVIRRLVPPNPHPEETS